MPHSQEMRRTDLSTLEDLLSRIPCVDGTINSGSEDKAWWVKFHINLEHSLAWKTVQELGYILNYLSITEKLPTVFKPVSPPPYLNGGPEDFLSWVIECDDPEFSPVMCADWLQNRLPQPIDNIGSWIVDD
ncbi:MAG: hypothetical protein QM645_07585 [Asticcacaulis sp.]